MLDRVSAELVIGVVIVIVTVVAVSKLKDQRVMPGQSENRLVKEGNAAELRGRGLIKGKLAHASG